MGRMKESSSPSATQVRLDALLLALEAFGGQDDVQNPVSGLVPGFVSLDLLLHLVQVGVLFFFALGPAEDLYLMLQVVVLLVHQFHALGRHFVSVIL